MRGDCTRFINAQLAGRYNVDSCIGVGGYGSCWRATSERGEFCVTTFFTYAGAKPEIAVAQRLMAITGLMDHRNLVQFKEVLPQATVRLRDGDQYQDPMIVSEYCDGGELWNYMYPYKYGEESICREFTERQARFLVRQVVDVLHFLHHPAVGVGREPYYHCDIKDQNFVLSGTTLKLIDYGCMRSGSKLKEAMRNKTWKGHETYFAPPDECGGEYVDVCAAGLLLLRLLTGNKCTLKSKCKLKPDQSAKETSFRDLKQWKDAPPGLDEDDAPRMDLLGGIFRTEPQTLSSTDLLQHKWVKELECEPEDTMRKELRSRYGGISSGYPRSTSIFPLTAPEVPKTKRAKQDYQRQAVEIMRGVALQACEGKQPEDRDTGAGSLSTCSMLLA